MYILSECKIAAERVPQSVLGAIENSSINPSPKRLVGATHSTINHESTKKSYPKDGLTDLTAEP